MDTRQAQKPSNSKQQCLLQPGDWTSPASQAWPASARPLSDIRELTEPSLLDALTRKSKPIQHDTQTQPHRQSSFKRGPSQRREGTVKIIERNANSGYKYEVDNSETSSDSAASGRDNSSMYSIPISSIPIRASSQAREATRTLRSISSKLSLTPTQKVRNQTVPNHGKSCSPVKQGLHLDTDSPHTPRRIPSRTFIRIPHPRDILDFPIHRHSRIGLELQTAAPLFVGGGSIEGSVRLVVDDAERIRQQKNLTIGRLAVDLIGVEETSSCRRSIFLSLGTELLDADHPPPKNMLDPDNRHQAMDSFWTLMPSSTCLPFMLSLPLDTGPPPFHSKHARIRFVLCATLLVKDSGRQYLVRCSQDMAVLSTYDPERALRSLPSPLTASDEFSLLRSGTIETIKITAGLHRQVWVGGSTIFVDVHIANGSRKTIKKLELSLERDILYYRHAAAATLEQSASQARIFESNDKSILSKSCLKQGGQGWTGVGAYGTTTRTCDLDIPRGHATVKCGKFFEVRYFLNISISTSHTKLVSVQLPIILIHMNSLDVVPNSVAQVAAAIEEKKSQHIRGRSHNASERNTKRHNLSHSTPPTAMASLSRGSSKLQGRAFAVPRQQSLDRANANAADLHQLGLVINSSPRKHGTPKRPQRGAVGTTRVTGGTANATIVSRPAREIHKQPSNLSLGGISVGSYTIFNGSSFSGAGMEYVTPPSKRKGRIFETSIPGRPPQPDESRHHNGGVKDHYKAVRGTHSFDSVRSRKSTTPSGKSRWRQPFGASSSFSRKENASVVTRQVQSALGQHSQQPSKSVINAHTLGLTKHVGGFQPSQYLPSSQPLQPLLPNERPSREGAVGVARALSWRTKDDAEWDKSRFEFKAVEQRKGSKERGGGFKGWLWALRSAKQQQQQQQQQEAVVRRDNWL